MLLMLKFAKDHSSVFKRIDGLGIIFSCLVSICYLYHRVCSCLSVIAIDGPTNLQCLLKISHMSLMVIILQMAVRQQNIRVHDLIGILSHKCKFVLDALLMQIDCSLMIFLLCGNYTQVEVNFGHYHLIHPIRCALYF